MSRQENVVVIVAARPRSPRVRAELRRALETGRVERAAFVEPRPRRRPQACARGSRRGTASRCRTDRQAIARPDAGADLLARDHRGADALDPRPGRLGGRGRRRRLRRPAAGAGRVTSGARTATSAWKLPLLERVMRATSPASARALEAGGRRAQLHAREGHGRRRPRLRGSYNLSRSGERNAENVLEIDDPQLADQLRVHRRGARALPALRVPGRHGLITPTRSWRAAST